MSLCGGGGGGGAVKSFSCKTQRCVEVRLRLGWGFDNYSRKPLGIGHLDVWSPFYTDVANFDKSFVFIKSYRKDFPSEITTTKLIISLKVYRFVQLLPSL